MQDTQVTVQFCTLIAENVYLLRVSIPSSYIYQAGQYTYVRAPHMQGAGGERIFSFANASNGMFIDFLFRQTTSDYKQWLIKLKPNNDLLLSEPIGYFNPKIFPKLKEAIFIAGGIGIAPFKAILEEKKQDYSVNLFWSNKSKNTTPLFSEIEHLCENKDFPLYTVFTQAESVRFTYQSIIGKIHLTNNSYIFLAGGSDFVDYFSEQFQSHGFPNNHIIQEAFTGYF